MATDDDPPRPVEWIGIGAAGLVLGLLAFFVHWGGYLHYMIAGGVGKWVSVLLVERRTRRLRDDPNGGQFAATLILQREVPYVYDEGLVAFEDGWLVFQGHRCTLSVGAGDIVKLSDGAGKVEFRFESPGGLVEAVLKTRTDSRFTQAAKAWRAARKASEWSVLPPILPNENAARAGRTLIQIALVVGVPIKVGFALRGGRVDHIFVPLAAAGAFVRDGPRRRDQGCP